MKKRPNGGTHAAAHAQRVRDAARAEMADHLREIAAYFTRHREEALLGGDGDLSELFERYADGCLEAANYIDPPPRQVRE